VSIFLRLSAVGWLILVAALWAAVGDEEEPVRFVGSVAVSNSDYKNGYHDGQLPPAVGVHNYQILRANRSHPEWADGLGWTYNHAPMLAYANGQFYCQYLTNPIGEHIPPGVTMLTHSKDGRHWSRPQVLFPIYPLANEKAEITYPYMHQRMGFYMAPNGRFLTMGFYGSPYGDGIGRVVREIRPDDSLGPIYFIRVNDTWKGPLLYPSDGRQTFPCPLTRTALPQLTHQDAVRQEDQVHVAGLTTAVPDLTFAHAQMLLAVPIKLQWIMLAGRTDVVGNDIVMGNLVSLFSMIPEAAGVLNVFAIVINQSVVDGNNALRAVTGIRAFLEPGQTFQVKGLFIPVAAAYPAVQAGLVRGDGKFPVDGRDVFLVGDHQAGQVLGEMAAFGFIGEQIPQAAEGFLDDDWKFNDSWHRNILHDIIGHVTINVCRQKAHSDSSVSILQKFSNNARLRDECLNMELFTGLPDARVSIETYRQCFFEERLHGALGYVPPREFKEQWLTAHPDFCMGALPPAPGI